MAEQKVEMVEVPKAEFEQMKKVLTDQAEAIKSLQAASMAGAGMDPAIAARSKIGRSLVQFTAEYNRMAVPSELQKGAMVYPGYSCREGEIVNLKKDEIERLEKDRPGLLITDQKKFVVQVQYGFEVKIDKKTGVPERKQVKTEIPVETLTENAVDKG